ncbi:MAG: FAD-dependent oxidoreductase [Thermodesulfobacteriota bacterium]
MDNFSDRSKIKVAIIGSGPAGFYTADHLFKKLKSNVQIDMFDRLPTPYGLVRSGVAPDHQKIKSVTRIFDKIASNENFRFFGYVELGKDIIVDELKQYYHQIVFSTGAQTDKKLDIPGENLCGSHPATEFVAWYNGHPDYKDADFDLSCESAAIVGVGNVAIDVARILCLSENELLKTDIADYAMDALLNSNIKQVYLLGRRGPAQAAFTNPEIRELGELEDTSVKVVDQEIELDSTTKDLIEDSYDSSTIKKLELLSNFLKQKDSAKRKNIIFRFLVSPTEITGGKNDKVKSLKIVKNKLILDEKNNIKPIQTDEHETLDVGLVFRSIGYQGVPISDVPFNDRWGVIPNNKGRIHDPVNNQFINGLYASGWIKRGPTGVIGTNKGDSSETVDCMVEDINNGLTLNPQKNDITNLIINRKPNYFSYEDWHKINNFEISKGESTGRPRVKLYEINKMLELVKN